MAVPQSNLWANIGEVGNAEWETFTLPQLPIPVTERDFQFISRPITIPWDVREWDLRFDEIIMPAYQVGSSYVIHAELQYEDSDLWEDFTYGDIFDSEDEVKYIRYVLDMHCDYQIESPIVDFVSHDLDNERFPTMFAQPYHRLESSYILSSAPTTIYGLSDPLSLKVGLNAAGTSDWRALLLFPLDKYDAKWDLDDTWFELCADLSAETNIAVYRITADWDQDQVTWNNRLTGTPWTTPGGDIDVDPLFEFTVTAAGWVKDIGRTISELRLAVKAAIAGTVPYYGFMLVATELDSYQTFRSTRCNTVDVDTRRNPQLIMQTTDNYVKLTQPLTENPLASEFRVYKASYTLESSGQIPPYTLATGVPRLTDYIEVTDLVLGYSIEQNRSDMADTLSLDVIDDETGAYANYWNPMDVIIIYERVSGVTTQNSFIKKGTFVIDSDPESVEAAIPTLRVQGRNCAKYGLLTAASGKWEAGNVEVSEVELTLVSSDGDFKVYRHLTANGDYSYNWNQITPPYIYKYKNDINTGLTDDQVPFTFKDGVLFMVYGDGSLYVSTEAWNTSEAEGGLGSPAHIYAVYSRWKTPVDDIEDCNALHQAIYDVLLDAGFQHVDPSAVNYIKNCIPVLTDFVFDRVYNYVYTGRTYGGPMEYIDITGTTSVPKVQQETDTAKHYDADMVSLMCPGEMLYFMLSVENHRFTHLYMNLRTMGVGGSIVWEVYNGSSWTEVSPISAEEYTFSTWAEKTAHLDDWLRKCWQDSRWAYDQDDKAATFESSGIVAFDETDLASWTAVKLSDLDAGVPVTSDAKGFWMRARCVTAPTSAIELHRFAGKEMVVLPSDNKTNIVRIWDDKKHLEVIDEWLAALAPPNYYFQINEQGDVDTAYIMQQTTAAYEITNDFTVSRERNDTQIYTQVNVRLSENTDRTSVLDYAKSLNGATVVYSGYADPLDAEADLRIWYEFDIGVDHWTSDEMIIYADNSNKVYDPAYAIDQSMASSMFIGFGGGQNSPIGGTKNGKSMPGDHNTSYLSNRDVLIVVLPEEIKLYRVGAKVSGLGGNCPYNSVFSVLVRAEAPGSPWITAISRAAGTSDLKDIKYFDFTKDADPDLPTVKYIKIRIDVPGPINVKHAHSHTTSYSYFVSARIFSVIAEGVALDEPVYASATLGTTPPFNTAADILLMDKYRVRALNISDKNPYLKNIDEAQGYALNMLREAYRLYDPLAVDDINPYAQLGQTVRYKNSILSTDKVNGALYVIEEISHKRGGEVNTRLVPYRG